MINFLKDAVYYSTDRVSLDKLNLNSYISTENLIQNKLGKTDADKLPAQKGKVTGFIENDILVSNIRPYLKKIWYANTSGGSSADILTFRVKDTYIPKFVYYTIFRDEFFEHMMNGSKGTKMPRGDKTQVLNFPIPSFKKNEQKKIANALSLLDEKIELNNKINTELEAMVKLIYDYWFVQFDFPDANGKPYKSSGGKMVYNQTLKREIPDGWGESCFGAYNTVKKGELITQKTVKTGKIKVVAAGLNYSYFHSTPNYDKNIITVSGSGASAGFVNFWREPIFASDCITVRGPSDADTLLALHYLKIIQEYIFKQARGSAQPHVYPNDISRLKYLVPPKNLVEAYGKVVLSANDKIAINIKENEQLSEIRDWLLPMLMNGQVTVKDTHNQCKKGKLKNGSTIL